MNATSDVLALAQSLLRFRSVTPEDDGLYDWLTPWLQEQGFECYRHRFGKKGGYHVDNLYARWSRERGAGRAQR